MEQFLDDKELERLRYQLIQLAGGNKFIDVFQMQNSINILINQAKQVNGYHETAVLANKSLRNQIEVMESFVQKSKQERQTIEDEIRGINNGNR